MVGKGGLSNARFAYETGMERQVIISNHQPGGKDLGDQFLTSHPDHGNVIGLC